MDSNNEKVLGEIKKSYDSGDGKLIPFIGAGFSKNAKLQDNKKYPEWDEFVDHLSEDAGLSDNQRKYVKKDKIDPMLATEYCIAKLIGNELSTNAWAQECRKKLGEIVKKHFIGLKLEDDTVSDVHNTLVKKFNIIYTSNWDELLEKALDTAVGKGKYDVYFNYGHLIDKKKDKKKDNKKKLIKIHGCISDGPEYKSLIATRSAYYNSMLYRHPMYIKFQHDIAFNDFIFIGFSFADQNITYLLQEISDMKNRTLKSCKAKKHKIFLVFPGVYDEMQYKLFKNSFGVDIYFCKKNKYNDFLRSLSR